MSVYVDDMYRYPVGQFGRMKMSHLIADTTDELLAIVRAIGVNPRWIQHAGTRDEHFDIAISKRAAAIAAGAVPITYRECGAMNKRRRVTGALGTPSEAIEWLEQFIAARRESRANAALADSRTHDEFPEV
ncbi:MULTISPECIES: DUF4031 domain-containing protein [Burkholderia cepacia complex]|uniref:DUF4031 domain-containing protein n=1 Tax=Burkholderia cepacia complex TaxID=87882 RepID=UPI00075E3BA1|nr:DUF4031 domain-containing protein [Burkholderia cenocepacia]KVF49549.1 hypothetical protein WJ14_31835 [Burkholderia cenocepacia]